MAITTALDHILTLSELGGTTVTLPLRSILERSPKTLLYFYPKDNTPGCTLEGQDFSRLKEAFLGLGIQIVGVSRDSVASHEKFRSSCHIHLDLISDPDGHIHEAFNAIGEKKLYGKVSRGVIRSTVLLASDGEILREWRNVQATGHAEKVLADITK